ncbi:MAG TPA: hypothetical protein VF913_12445 [Xanthobacteraceae bacterium]
MHKPLERITTEEFIDSIIDLLKPLKYPHDECFPEHFISFSDGDGIWERRNPDLPLREAVCTNVAHVIADMRKVIPQWEKRGDRRANREYAKKLDKALSEVQRLLKLERASNLRLFGSMYIDPWKMTESEIEAALGRGRLIAKKPGLFSDMMWEMREACANAGGNHPNYDLAAELCAQWAHYLIDICSSHGRPTMGPNTRYHQIAALLYEAVTGRKPGKASLVRACNKNVRKWVHRNLHTQP